LLAAGSVTVSGLIFAQAPTVPTPAPTTQTSPDGSTTTATSTTVDSTGKPVQSVSTSHVFGRGKKNATKEDKEKVTASKDTKKNAKKTRMADSLIGVDSKLPDKQLFDKAQVAIKKGHFDVGRLDLQTMLNTYPDSQYQLRAKLAVADSWYREGGTAALTQAEQEYRDFCVFFPNAPEAAEAQMRIGDIYFKQMDKPDRDYAKALHAEEEYRRMITDYPDSKLVPDAKQRLREVQEVLATREANIAQYYATRENWAAVIARYQTVVDTYPLYSHMDDTLIGIGDAYEAQARYIRGLKLPEGPKAKLEQLYDGRAIDAYREVVLKHSAAPHVEDARDRLAAMNVPIPTPSKEEVAASEALENSRRNYRMSDRVKFLILHQPDTVLTAQTGEPEMTDPKVTTAPAILAKVQGDFTAALSPAAAAPAAAPSSTGTTPAPAETPTQPAGAAAPLALSDVGTADSTGSVPPATTFTPASPSAPAANGNSLGVEILTPGVRAATPETAPAATGKPDPNYGLKAVGPANADPLPAAEHAADAPDRPNTITTATPPAAAAPAKGKAKPEFDKDDESSSKHKKKKGIKKIIPLPS
jgi:outer membrane protein assembly factor BamD